MTVLYSPRSTRTPRTWVVRFATLPRIVKDTLPGKKRSSIRATSTQRNVSPRTRFYAKKLAKRTVARQPIPSLAPTVTSRKRVRDSDDEPKTPPPKRRRGLNTDGATQSEPRPGISPSSRRLKTPVHQSSPTAYTSHPLRRHSAMPLINPRAIADPAQLVPRRLERDDDSVHASPAGTPELRKMHLDSEWRVYRRRLQDRYPPFINNYFLDNL